MRCSAITRAGERCQHAATHGTFCYVHSPETAAARSRQGRKGGLAGGNGRPGRSELVLIKHDIRATIDAVLDGRVDRGRAAVAFQGFGYLLRAVEIERKVREADEFAQRLDRLEEAANTQGARWGA